MKKICYITTVSMTLNAFVLKSAEYIHNHTDWDITFICSEDAEFASRLPSYIHFHPIHMKRGISLSGIKAMIQMKRLFTKEKYDLIQYSTPNASLYASLAGKMARVPVRLYCQWGIAYVGFSGIKRCIFKCIEKLVCTLSTHIEPDSKSNLKFAHNEGLYPESKGSVIGNGSACGVDFNKFDISHKDAYRSLMRNQLGIPENAFVFGFVGRITKDKGVNELLTVFKSKFEHIDNTYLLLVGPSENDATVNVLLYEWAQKSSKVVFTGFTNEVEKYLSIMDVYILPSYREGFGMGVIEAEAMGVPVIVTDIPGPIDAMINQKTGIVIKKADNNSLFEAMKSMLDNRAKLEDYSKEAYIFAKSKFEQSVFFELMLKDRMKLIQK